MRPQINAFVILMRVSLMQRIARLLSLLKSIVYVPILFIGIFIYMLLAGPGKISLDYLISIKLFGHDRQAEDELEKA